MDDAHNTIRDQLIDLIHQLLTELEVERAAHHVSVDSVLDRELGIGSLERAELLRRIEQSFAVHIPNKVMASARTVNDLISAIKEAKPQIEVKKHKIVTVPKKTHVDPSSQTNLIDVLKLYANKESSRAHIYLQDDAGAETVISYGKLYRSASSVAKGLVSLGLKQDETVAIMLPTSDEFFYAFFGVLLAGGIPVPIYPPFRPDQIEEYTKREAGILDNAQVRILISFRKVKTLTSILKVFISSLHAVTTVADLEKLEGDLPEFSAVGEGPALIQYTSGSTGAPKGVLLSHQNLLANLRAFGQAAKITPADVGVSWLPLYHDMGLIGAWLGSLYFGFPVTIMSPLVFLSRPERWLWAIHYHRATLSGAPNFAYELCVSKISDKAIEGLDLRSWRLAFDGSEAIYPKTLERFYRRFAKYGLRKSVLFPVYGLAENAVALTFPPLNREPLIDKIDREIFEKEKRALPVNDLQQASLEFVSCGQPLLGHEIRIVDENAKPVPEREVGHLQFKGPSAMQGYYRNPEKTEKICKDGWFDTGDYAYLANNELFLTGRAKDIIIKAGRNIHPHQVEEVVGQLQSIREGCVVAFGAEDPSQGTERFVVVAETLLIKPRDREAMISKISEVVLTAVGLPPDQVVLVPPRVVPKTSSGKLQRSAAKQAFLLGKLGKPSKPTWWQICRLSFISIGKKALSLLTKVGKIVYGSYVGLMFLLILIPFWLAFTLLPAKRAVKLGKIWARSILFLAACPLKVEGKSNLKSDKPMVFVLNHASYIDALVCLAVLPENIAIVGKKELLSVPVVGGYFKKLGFHSVNRWDFVKSLEEVSDLNKTLVSGRSILIFPEGTFTYAAGIRPFKLGAFKVAVETSQAVCPVALKGTRSILRDDIFLPKPGKITVTICEPIHPEGKGWEEVLRLRSLSRAEISKYSGEALIDLMVAGAENHE